MNSNSSNSRLAFLALVVLAASLRAQPLPLAQPGDLRVSAERLQRLHEGIKRFVDRGQHAGVVTLLARNGRIVDWQTYGVRDLETRAPMEKNTICRIYSMSKIITSVAVLCLVEDGRIGLDDPLARFLPEFNGLKVMTGGTADAPILTEARRPVTIKHLLTHTSGFSYDILGDTGIHVIYQRADLWNAPSMKEFLARAAKLPLKAQPGDEFNYSISDDILGGVIEVVSGKDFEAFLRQRIFEPLAMEDTSFDVPPQKRTRLASLSRIGADGKLVKTDPIIGAYAEKGRGFASGGAGLFSTIGDYLRFAQMLANGGQLGGRRVLSRKMVELMTANHLANLPKPNHQFSEWNGWGLGVEVQLDLGRSSLPGSPGAFGWYGAATTYCRIDPTERTVALLFAQHVPFNEHRIFEVFASLYYSALE